MAGNRVIHSITTISLLLVIPACVCLCTTTASATPIEEVPEGLAASIGVSEYTAKMLLAIAGMISVGLALAVFRLPVAAVLIIEVGLVGMFVAIDWLSDWMLVLAAILVAGAFASMVKGGMDFGTSG